MADDQRSNPEDQWVAPPLDGAGSTTNAYVDPFSQRIASVPPPPSAVYQEPSASHGSAVPPYAHPYPAPGYAAPWAGGQFAPRTDKNWLGITSLVLSIVGLSLPGVVLGHLGLGAVKRGEADNRGIALAGTVVGWIGLAIGAIGVVAAIAVSWVAATSYEDDLGSPAVESSSPAYSEPDSSDDWADDLAMPGDGVFGIEEANGYFLIYVDGALETDTCLAPSLNGGYDLDVVSCSDSHVGEVFLTAPLSDLIVGDDVYGDATWTQMYDACTAAFSASAGASGVDASVGWWVFAASDDGDLSDDDTFLCVASIDFSATTGSLFTGAGGQTL